MYEKSFLQIAHTLPKTLASPSPQRLQALEPVFQSDAAKGGKSGALEKFYIHKSRFSQVNFGIKNLHIHRG
jgi:hypothetical protein